MTENNSFKKQVRSRMALTGETYTQAYKALDTKVSASSPSDLHSTKKRSSELVLADLFEGKELKDLQTLLDTDETGLILVGSTAYRGKTTTLHSIVNSYLNLHKERRLILIEDEKEMELNEGDNSILRLVGSKTAYSTEMGEGTWRMRANAIVVNEIRQPQAWHMLNVISYEHHSFATMHSQPTLADFLDRMKNGYGIQGIHGINAIILTEFFVRNDEKAYANTAIVFTEEVKKAASLYWENEDTEQLNATLRRLGIVEPAEKIEQILAI